ncbi:capsule biosynthesis protein [Stutzerimonas sp. VN223-3]|uniref:capsule biosynthesis protein n=1 Tax=Stutzerimonas sp. VN223-3 TaxID=3384601 RepID=UPI0038B60A5B
MSEENLTGSWRDKASALDRYRWLLLRERHGVLSSALRFMRDAMNDWLFGVRARRSVADVVVIECCDFLLLQSAPKVIKFQRKRLFIERLRARGHSLIETAIEERDAIVRQRQLRKPPEAVPTRYFGYAAYAEWVVEKFQPSILLNDRNGSLYSPFLRLALNRRSRLLVQLAHATTVESSPRLSMNDYDYYFIFGQSSLDALRARPLRFGGSRAVLAGSHMIDMAYDLPPAEPVQGAVLILGVGPDKEKEAGYNNTYSMLRDWVQQNPERKVLIKAHPRSQVPFWQRAAGTLPNLTVLPACCTLSDALAQANVVINVMSNAVIEAALACRPVLFVNLSKDADIFRQEKFFGSRIRSPDALASEFLRVLRDYPQCLEASARFANFHLEQGVRGLERNLELLECLLQREPIPYFSLAGHAPCQA